MKRETIIKVFKLIGKDPPTDITEMKRGSDIKESKNKDAAAIINSEWLMKIIGIGPVKALELYNDGITPKNISKIMDKLPIATQIYYKYKPMPISRKDIPKLANIIMNGLDKKTWIIAGSYRRGKPVSGDLDIVYVGDEKKLAAVLDKMKLWIPYAHGKYKISGILTPNTGNVHVDLYITTRKDFVPMLLYATGSQQFNIVMRKMAKNAGYRLNQYGLFKLPTNTIPKNIDELRKYQVTVKKEEDIFKIIGMTYKEPNAR